MKTIFIIIILLFSQLVNAQSTSDWKLSKRFYKGPDWTGSWEYSYDNNNRLKQVKYFQDKKLFYTSKSFVYNATGQLTSYEDVFTNKKTYTQRHYMTYTADNKLHTRELKELKEGTEKFRRSYTYQWGTDKVTAVKKEMNFAGMMESKRTYTLDKNGNATLITDAMKGGTPSNITYTGFDSKPNPLLYTTYPYEADVLSPNNPLKGDFGASAPTIYTMKYNAAGLPTTITETSNNGPYDIVNGTTYTYVKVAGKKD